MTPSVQPGTNCKGILLAGGSGTRLYPLTQFVSKQLLPIYDKPLLYYPLSILMLAGIRDILAISTPEGTARIQQVLGNGAQWGLSLQYAVQSSPRGVGDALLIAKSFIDRSRCALILGDNIFYGEGLIKLLRSSASISQGATIFAYPVHDPERYGVVEFDGRGRVISLEEKPIAPKSRYAVTGLYFYDEQAVSIAEKLHPSARGELEITDINREYLARGQLHTEVMGRGMAWFDAGTHESMLDAAIFFQTIERRQGLRIGCPEEVAYRNGFITADQLIMLTAAMNHTAYGEYLLQIARENVAQYPLGLIDQ